MGGGRYVDSGGSLMKRTPRHDQYDHLQAAYERAQALPNQPSMEELTARIKTPRTVRLEPMAALATAAARAASRKERTNG